LPAGASSTIDAGTRSPLTIGLRLIETALGPAVAQKSLNVVPLGARAASQRAFLLERAGAEAGARRGRAVIEDAVDAADRRDPAAHQSIPLRVRARLRSARKVRGLGCAVTLIVVVRVVPLAAALMVTVNPRPL
jgi:hypothetical protein